MLKKSTGNTDAKLGEIPICTAKSGCSFHCVCEFTHMIECVSEMIDLFTQNR